MLETYNTSTMIRITLNIMIPFLFSLETLRFSTLRKSNTTGKMKMKIDARTMVKHFEMKLVLEN